ncbi:hypothetical protein AJ79_02020 [Helicocarpus griseus UAMH5409]|uniref:Amino acid permease/ SLC12A domain-containing protein n=1 Tax=Helicocarpus griseus UAMH5409 TaxID=1447875 RepID=A0A2B7Y477_9EURO|nr:hypothetical protein AJ79_02020 [Helicocarpus griseus UAMH5409]
MDYKLDTPPVESDDLSVNNENHDSQVSKKYGTISDQRDMERMGKKQEMKRGFGFFSIVGFTCVLMSTWESQLSGGSFGLNNGGPGGLAWMYLIAYTGFLIAVACMAEMASMAPTTGGQYHWVSEFSPKRYQKFLSYVSGWLLVLGWQAGVAINSYLAGTEVQGLIILNYPEYTPERWHGTLMMIAVVIIAVIFNTLLIKKLPVIEGTILLLHIIGFFAILIPLWVTSPRKPPSEVFFNFQDNGGWGSVAGACVLGILSPVFSFIGPDSAAHMSEEIKDASVVLPRAMMGTALLNGAMGYVMLISYLICMGNIEEVTKSPTGFPFIQVFYNSTQSHAGASIMTSILIVMCICGSVSNVATASREMFAFARDRGMPFSDFLSYVRPGWDIPLNAILVTLVICSLLSLINIGSSVAFNALVSLGVAALVGSYIISTACILHRRLSGGYLPPARWSLGRWGVTLNAIAVVYLSLVFAICFFPPSREVTVEGMQWSSLIFGSVVIFSTIYYFIYGRKVYDGPVVLVKQI